MNRAGENGSLAAFLAVVESDRDERCDAVLAEAKQKAREIERAARRDARLRVARAVRDARARSQAEVDAARAALGTEERQLAYDVKKTLLERGMARLEKALSARWSATDGRRRWIDALVKRAGALLPAGVWQVQYPADFDANELADLAECVRRFSSETPNLTSNDHAGQGLCIEASGASLDGTLRGLFANRNEVEGRMLLEISSDRGGAR